MVLFHAQLCHPVDKVVHHSYLLFYLQRKNKEVQHPLFYLRNSKESISSTDIAFNSKSGTAWRNIVGTESLPGWVYAARRWSSCWLCWSSSGPPSCNWSPRKIGNKKNVQGVLWKLWVLRIYVMESGQILKYILEGALKGMCNQS